MAVVIELAYDGDEHILADGETLCDAEYSDEDTRVVHHTRSPIADASIHLCALCARRWRQVEDEVERAEAVRCAVDRVEDGELWTCAEVVPTTEARRLEHPHADQAVPSCPSCYRWLCEDVGENDVATAYEDAVAWRIPTPYK